MRNILFLLLAAFSAITDPGNAQEIVFEEMSEKSMANVGRDGSFEAQLWFFSAPTWGVYSWAGDEMSRVDSKKIFAAEERAEILLVFKNPVVDAKGFVGVLFDYTIRRPDGSIAERVRNENGWAMWEACPQGSFVSTCHMINFRLSRFNPPGIYTVEVAIRDVPGKRAILLKNELEFVAKN
jgi:hypothetical protein